ncbi:MAG: FadR family transcriptional regulator [Polyangiaceae bacterium]|nr:FadR family transcriptional regulator [Myxococcales bacterium]MCB9585529.1 FadR family transcriptional regulator [Polyangiaceae bacterium]
MSLNVSPISPASAVDACVTALQRAILEGELKVGERLPPERTLAASFGVNRVTVRTALSRLQTAGLLSVRQGSGYTVHDFATHGGPELLPDMARVARERGQLLLLIEDLLRMRRHMARAVLEVLPERATSEDLDIIRAAINEFERLAGSGDLAALTQADLEVVRCMLRATHSPALALCMNPISSAVSEIPELPPLIYAQPSTNVAGYRLLLSWLESKAHARPDAALLVAELERRDSDTLARLKRLLSRPKARGKKHRDPIG